MMTPAPHLNVNLATCSSSAGSLNAARRVGNPAPVDKLPCEEACPDRTLALLPSQPPSTLVLQLALGQCACQRPHNTHLGDCPGKPTRVYFSLRGADWRSYEVVDAWTLEPSGLVSDGEHPEALRLARERWGIVQALVLGRRPASGGGLPEPLLEALSAQRDAVYAGLTTLVRLELAAEQAQYRVDEAFPYAQHQQSEDTEHRARRPSAGRLVAYIQHLLQAVGDS
jgi:hypothetical protein